MEIPSQRSSERLTTPRGRTRLPLDELTQVVATTVSRRADWWHQVRLPSGHDRWWTRLTAQRDTDVWLLTWLPGQATDLHDHGESAASFAVVSGHLAEIRADPTGATTRHRWRPGPVTWLAPGVVHEVTGAGSGPSVSVHAYSPPLTRMTYYDSDTRAGLRVLRTVLTEEPEDADASS
jgi:predicted metal-dependent enzyme (double-stranded beta helix superfamily)